MRVIRATFQCMANLPQNMLICSRWNEKYILLVLLRLNTFLAGETSCAYEYNIMFNDTVRVLLTSNH